jgi:hypothetical protein
MLARLLVLNILFYIILLQFARGNIAPLKKMDTPARIKEAAEMAINNSLLQKSMKRY